MNREHRLIPEAPFASHRDLLFASSLPVALVGPAEPAEWAVSLTAGEETEILLVDLGEPPRFTTRSSGCDSAEA